MATLCNQQPSCVLQEACPDVLLAITSGCRFSASSMPGGTHFSACLLWETPLGQSKYAGFGFRAPLVPIRMLQSWCDPGQWLHRLSLCSWHSPGSFELWAGNSWLFVFGGTLNRLGLMILCHQVILTRLTHTKLLRFAVSAGLITQSYLIQRGPFLSLGPVCAKRQVLKQECEFCQSIAHKLDSCCNLVEGPSKINSVRTAWKLKISYFFFKLHSVNNDFASILLTVC